VIADESSALIDNIQGYVNRLISDFSNKTIRRNDTALSSLSVDTEVLETESKTMLEDQKLKQQALAAKGAEWSAATLKSLQEGQTMNSTMKNATDARIAAVVNKSQVAESEVKASVDSTNSMSDDHLKACNAQFIDEIKYIKKRTEETGSRTQAAADAHLSSVEDVKIQMTGQNNELGKSCEVMRDDLATTTAVVKKYTETTSDDLFDHEADGVNYVMKEIERDVMAAVSKKGYTFPDEFDATDPYPTILSDLPQDWTRESEIIEGKVEPGKPTDFPGTLAEDDPSGLLSTTADKDVPVDKQTILDNAGYQSSPEDYESNEIPSSEAHTVEITIAE